MLSLTADAGWAWLAALTAVIYVQHLGAGVRRERIAHCYAVSRVFPAAAVAVLCHLRLIFADGEDAGLLSLRIYQHGCIAGCRDCEGFAVHRAGWASRVTDRDSILGRPAAGPREGEAAYLPAAVWVEAVVLHGGCCPAALLPEAGKPAAADAVMVRELGLVEGQRAAIIEDERVFPRVSPPVPGG